MGCEMPTCLAIARRLSPSLRSRRSSCSSTFAPRGLEIVQFYVDVGQSGGKASRPELDRLMMDARRRKFNIVLVARLDRLARSLKQLVMTLDELRELGISFTSLQEGFDTSTSTGILLFQVVGAIAEFERSQLGRLCHLG